MDEQKAPEAPTLTDVQQLQFLISMQAVELTQLRAQAAQAKHNDFVQSLQVAGFDLTRGEQGQLAYVKKA